MIPFHMLQGRIKTVKEIKLTAGYIERYYRDEMGRKAIVLMKDLGNHNNIPHAVVGIAGNCGTDDFDEI